MEASGVRGRTRCKLRSSEATRASNPRPKYDPNQPYRSTCMRHGWRTWLARCTARQHDTDCGAPTPGARGDGIGHVVMQHIYGMACSRCAALALSRACALIGPRCLCAVHSVSARVSVAACSLREEQRAFMCGHQMAACARARYAPCAGVLQRMWPTWAVRAMRARKIASAALHRQPDSGNQTQQADEVE